MEQLRKAFSQIIGDKISRKILIDMLINIVGTAFPLFALQIIIYPVVARTIDANAYGQMQSALSIIYLIGGTLGGTLSTTRLVQEREYIKRHIEGDYNYMVVFLGIINIFVTFFIITIYFNDALIYENILIVIVSTLNYLQNYFDVGFRLQINYKGIFITKVLSCVGYLLGFILFRIYHMWQYIFIVSYIFSIIYSVAKTKLLFESNKKTKLYTKTTKVFCNLGIASLLSKALTYFDKLMLYPILGGEAVAVYFAANIFGKLILQALEPITNVILSYLSKQEKVTRNIWIITFIVGSTFCIFMYIFCLVICKPILYVFYEQWANAAVPLIPITTASLCISSFISIINPLILKSINSNRQIVINGVSLFVYVVLVLKLYQKFNLIGCCVALFVSYATKLMIINLLIWRKLSSNDE